LPLFTSLLSVQPALKSTVLRLIPRPTLDTALEALAQSAKKLRDAYPYSNTPPSFSQSTLPTTSFGFGSFNSGRTTAFGPFNRSLQLPPLSGSQGQTGGMRDSYIISRLRPHITEFVSACISYIPYFSCHPSGIRSTPSNQPSSASSSSLQPHALAIQALHKDKSHPTETFAFLAALTMHLLSQPALTQASLAPMLLPRLLDEWNAWVDRVDEVVNREGGMFGSETVSGWARDLDEFAESKGPEGFQAMREVQSRWVVKVGWLVGRMGHHPMDEEQL